MLKNDIELIITTLESFSAPVSIGEIADVLGDAMHKKTLQRRLKLLVEQGDVIAQGELRNTKYYLKAQPHLPTRDVSNASMLAEEGAHYSKSDDKHPIFSSQALSLLSYLNTPSYARKKSTYQFKLLEQYIPNKSQYVPVQVRERLRALGVRVNAPTAAGTYAKKISQRLLIDLSYNSSRLEGNTYSKLDTQKLIEQGLSASGKVYEESVMIVNHKEAIEFLIENAEEITLDPFTIRNIHALLSQDLLFNQNAVGNIRQLEVKVGKSAYLPLNNPHKLAEYFALLLHKANIINDPFEQSFFVLMHLSYLQAFEDVNKRTARLACNIPFIQHNLCPLSFVDVPQQDYFKTLLYFYETNNLQPALELFEWAYLRSCQQYEVIKESLGEIDPFRIQTRKLRKTAMGHIVREQLSQQAMLAFLQDFCAENNIVETDKFVQMTLHDLEHLHLGAIVGLGITQSMFTQWQQTEKSD